MTAANPSMTAGNNALSNAQTALDQAVSASGDLIPNVIQGTGTGT